MSRRAKAADRPILPGGTIGVLGSGQLGRMFAIAARRMGYRVHTFSPDDDTPTGQVADVEIQASYDDIAAVRAFAERVDIVTFEFENVPAATAEAAAEHAPVRPNWNALFHTQHRLREKNFLRSHDFPVAPFAAVSDGDQLRDALRQLGAPAVLKTAGWGYDGKGQQKILGLEDAAVETFSLRPSDSVLEAFVDFEREVSVIVARGVAGELATYDVFDNTHTRHILDVSVAPAEISPQLASEARSIAERIAAALDLVGLLCVEFFVARSGDLLVNELAPRPHNSGHLTFDAAATSQFEQQLRAICGLPLGATELLKPAAMANLLGDLWEQGEPNWSAALADPFVKLHLYGKEEPRVGRKMGHLTATGATQREAVERVTRARRALTNRG